MIKFKSYVNYFKDLSEQHVDIAHSSSSKSFFRLNIQEITNAMRSSIDEDSYVMALESYEHTPKDLHSDNHLREYTAAFMILKRVANLDDYDVEDTVIEKCEEIAIEVSKRMYANSIDYDDQFFKNIELSDFTFQKVGPLFDNWFGFRCQYNFSDTYPIAVDNSKWADL